MRIPKHDKDWVKWLQENIQFSQTRYGPRYAWIPEEGDFDELVRDGSHALKYDHHPVAICQKLVVDRRFRHVSFEVVCDAVMELKSTRSSWNAYGKIGEVESSYLETLARVGLYLGVSCLTCDGMAWQRAEPFDKRFCDCSYTDLDRFDKLFKKQLWIWRGIRTLNRLDGRFPLLCDDCYTLAISAHTKYRLYGDEDLAALQAVTYILENKSSSQTERKLNVYKTATKSGYRGNRQSKGRSQKSRRPVNQNIVC